MKPLRLGITKQQHASMRHPIDAIVNARGGLHHLNDSDVQAVGWNREDDR